MSITAEQIEVQAQAVRRQELEIERLMEVHIKPAKEDLKALKGRLDDILDERRTGKMTLTNGDGEIDG